MEYNAELIQALQIARFAAKQEDCLDIDQLALIDSHIQLLSQGQFGIISRIMTMAENEEENPEGFGNCETKLILNQCEPMTQLEVYKQGKKAGLDGMPDSANPHKYPSKEWTYWWDGWIDQS